MKKHAHLVCQLLPYLFLCGVLCSCSSSSESLVNTAPPAKDSRSNQLSLRWFPVTEAEGYTIIVDTESGQSFEVQLKAPEGCTHRRLEGYTSGICKDVVVLPEGLIAKSVKITAQNSQGESLATVSPVD